MIENRIAVAVFRPSRLIMEIKQAKLVIKIVLVMTAQPLVRIKIAK